MSTVVGIATGMFTLRDQIDQRESGTAEASLAEYQVSIADVCVAINEAQAAWAADTRRLGVRLRAARSVPALRDLLLGSASRSNAGTVELLTKLSELEPPEDVAAEQRALVAALQRNLERIRNYEHHLDGVQRFRELAAALAILYGIRVDVGRDALLVRTRITHLGGRHCRLAKPRVVPIITVADPDVSTQAGFAPPGRRTVRTSATTPVATAAGNEAIRVAAPPSALNPPTGDGWDDAVD